MEPRPPNKLVYLLGISFKIPDEHHRVICIGAPLHPRVNEKECWRWRSRLACNSHPDPHGPSAMTLMHPPRRLSCALRSYSSVYALRGDSVGDSHMLSEATLMRSTRLLLYALRGHSHALSKSLNLLFHLNRLVLKLNFSLSFSTRHPCTPIDCHLPRRDTHFGAR